MRVLGAYEKAKIYIEQHTELSEDTKIMMRKMHPGPTITISRETGIGAEKVCEALIKYFKNSSPNGTNDWVYFDKNLINKVQEDHNLPERFCKFLLDERLSNLNSLVNELLGLQPSKLKLLHKTNKTIYQLAEFGNVIIVGRAANIITANLKNTFHVRLVAPLNDRIRNAQRLYNISVKESADFIKHEDKQRTDFVLHYFHKDITDPMLYHLVLNTSLLTFDEIAETIGSIVIKKFPKIFEPFNFELAKKSFVYEN